MTRSTGAWLAALALVVAALVAVSWGWQQGSEETAFHAEVMTHGKMILVARAVGDISKRPTDAAPQFLQMELIERTPEDRIFRAIVRGEVGSREKALELVDSLPEGMPDADLLKRLYGGETVSDEERAALGESRGWFGRLAAIHGLPDDDPRREQFWEPVRKAARISIALSVLALPAFMAGAVLFVVMLVKLRRGTLRSRFRLHDEGSGDLPWLQVVVLGLAAVLALNVGLLAHLRVSPVITMWIPLVALLWPLMRRMRGTEWRGGLGISVGAGPLREMGAGLLGYLAGLPLVVVGLLVSAKLTELTGWKASHPLTYETLEGEQTATWMIVLSACIWAPLIEEFLFRGALYRYLRPRFSVVGSTSLTALLFAMVHPQGLMGIPAIWTLGVVFAGLREWRGSIWASMTAHALHNGMLVAMMLAIFG